MRRPYYELHVTVQGDPKFVRPRVEGIGNGWKFSAIDGDPTLGPGLKCYATLQLNSTKFTHDAAIAVVRYAGDTLRAANCRVVREKVELVVHDERI